MATAIEPPTTARVILETTKGPLEIELWAKEIPIASRNFLQRCAEGYYNGTKFHRILKGFMVQAGAGFRDQATSSFFADEFHSRIKYTGSRQRGIVGCANIAGKKNSNGSQFIITLGNGPQTQALNGKNPVFGRIVGDSIYNLARIESEGDLLEDGETPLYPVEITSAKVVEPYFDDLIYKEEKPSIAKEIAKQAATTKKKPKAKAKVRLSYDDEDEDGDAPASRPTKKRFKMKAAHEVMSDKSLVLESKEPVSAPLLVSAPATVPPKAKVEEPASPKGKEPDPEPEPIGQFEPAPKPKVKTAQELDQEFELLKSSFKKQQQQDNNPSKTKLEKNSLSVVDQERAAYVQKQLQGGRRKKDSNQREAQTMALLNKFTSRLSSAPVPPSKKTSAAPATAVPIDDNEGGSQDGESLYGSEDDEGDLYSHRFVPQHVDSKDDSLITQYTGTKHNDSKYGQDDPEFLLSKKKAVDAQRNKVDIGKRTGALMSTQKLRDELRRQKLAKLNQD